MTFDYEAKTAAAPTSTHLDSMLSSRRPFLIALSSLAFPFSSPAASHASLLPAVADQAWEALGGGPSDLYFPSFFEGTWDVSSLLVDISTPLGPKFVTNPESLERARRDDLGKTARYRVRWIKPSQDEDKRVIFDRAFNTESLLSMYYTETEGWGERIEWDPSNPNILSVSLPRGQSIRTRVTRRSSSSDSKEKRIETSEFFEQIFSDDIGTPARLKASQCFTKYKYRDEGIGGGGGAVGDEVLIVASQTVADFLTPFDNEALYAQAVNQPVAKYFYRIAFSRVK